MKKLFADHLQQSFFCHLPYENNIPPIMQIIAFNFLPLIVSVIPMEPWEIARNYYPMCLVGVISHRFIERNPRQLLILFLWTHILCNLA